MDRATVSSDHYHERGSKHVILAIWCMEFLQLSIVKSMGVLLPVLLNQFEAHTRNIGVVVSITFFCGNIIGKGLFLRIRIVIEGTPISI